MEYGFRSFRGAERRNSPLLFSLLAGIREIADIAGIARDRRHRENCRAFTTEDTEEHGEASKIKCRQPFEITQLPSYPITQSAPDVGDDARCRAITRFPQFQKARRLPRAAGHYN